MCGIAGIIGLGDRPFDPRAVKRMCDAIAHRGPDDAGYAFFRQPGPGRGHHGYWCEFTDDKFHHFNEHLPPFSGEFCSEEMSRQRFDVALGHRRLAIIDLSPYGHEPMSSSDRQLWLTYNGEIYNFPELKESLHARGHVFRSRTDAEVILHLWEEEGEKALPRLNGMFAFAILDRASGMLTLARDRFGVSPLYYAWTDDFLIFASEIKAILASGLIPPRLDPATVVEYMTFQNLYGEETLFSQIRLLPPGCYLQLPVGTPAKMTPPRRYVEAFPQEITRENPQECAAQVSDLFEKAVRRQLLADVPVGAYLSGGMDSGSIVSVAGRSIPRLLTFTGGFDTTNVDGIEQGFDERKMAERLSYILQTEHYDVVLHAGDMPAAMERLTWHLDDPRCGMCHQGWYAAKLASRFVKVCLAGGGGDELFGGYPWRYRLFMDVANDDEFEKTAFQYWHRLLPPDRLEKLFTADTRPHMDGARERFRAMLKGAPAPIPHLDRASNMLRRAFYVDYSTFLHGLLIVEDRLSTAHSLETRVPFLDNDLAAFALSIPPGLKVDLTGTRRKRDHAHMETAEGKQILRSAMERFLPPEYTRQKKQGFSPPDANWYRGPSMQYIKDILYDPKTRARPWFDPECTHKTLEEHFAGQHNHRLLIWSLLSLEWLQRHFVDKRAE
ncbi:MAG: asparagine synthase (glutamine-hydrolyzing) [Planctomycetota bacterium]